MTKIALISIANKKNLSNICNTLKKFNIKIISTSKTLKKIKQLGYKATEINKITNFN